MKNLKFVALFLAIASLDVFGAELTLNSETTPYESEHSNRFMLMAGVNSSLTKAGDLTNFALSYGRDFGSFWLDTNVIMTQGLFGELSENHASATGTTDDLLYEQKNTLTTLGVGVARETRYAQTLLPMNDIYELMAANLTYNLYKEDYSGKSFSGPGLLAKFALYKRFSDYFSAGAHFNYNISVVKRSKENDLESSSDRSLTLGFLTLGFNISFYL